MVMSEEIQDFLVCTLWTVVGIAAMAVIGALCWWAWASESLLNILSLAGVMALGVAVLVAGLLAWLKMTGGEE